MEHSSYEMETRTVTLHQTADYDSDNNMKETTGEDWLDLSILDAEAKPDLVNMDSGIIFDHDDGASMDSMMTNIYMNNNMAIGTNKNGNTVVNGSLAATKLPSNP